MDTISFKGLVPAFLWRDKNGYAVCKAVEWLMNQMITDLNAGLGLLYDKATMPEWRLDELAFSYNMPWYDYGFSVDLKRKMVQMAPDIQEGVGTAALLQTMLETVFESVVIAEWPNYPDSEPYHFRVEIAGNRAGELEDWARAAVEILKPLRCVFDGFVTHIAEPAITGTGNALQIGLILRNTTNEGG